MKSAFPVALATGMAVSCFERGSSELRNTAMGTARMPSVPGQGKRQAPEAWTFLTTFGLLSESQTTVLACMTSSGAAFRASPFSAHTQSSETFVGHRHLAVSLTSFQQIPLLCCEVRRRGSSGVLSASPLLKLAPLAVGRNKKHKARNRGLSFSISSST